MPSEKLLQQIQRSFMPYQPPQGTQFSRYKQIAADTCALANTLARLCPESRELSLALTHLEEVRLWANKAIAVNEERLPDGQQAVAPPTGADAVSEVPGQAPRAMKPSKPDAVPAPKEKKDPE